MLLQLLWTLSSTGVLKSDFTARGHKEMNFYMPHAVEIISETQLMLIDDGGDRPGCVTMSSTSTNTDLPCWSRAIVIEFDTDKWEAEIIREWASPVADDAYSSKVTAGLDDDPYANMAETDDFNLVGGNINYLGALGGGVDRYLVAFSDTANATYKAFELTVTAENPHEFELRAELQFSKEHAEVAMGNYRMTPLMHIHGEKSEATLTVSEDEAAMTSAMMFARAAKTSPTAASQRQ